MEDEHFQKRQYDDRYKSKSVELKHNNILKKFFLPLGASSKESIYWERQTEYDNNNNILCTDVDKEMDLHIDILFGKRKSFDHKFTENFLISCLEKHKIKKTKHFSRNANEMMITYYVPITHSIKLNKACKVSEFEYANEKNPDNFNNRTNITEENLKTLKYDVCIRNTEYLCDDSYKRYSPEWFYGKDTRPKNSSKSILNQDLKNQVNEYYSNTNFSDINIDEIEKN